jgi:hypothetical protein
MALGYSLLYLSLMSNRKPTPTSKDGPKNTNEAEPKVTKKEFRGLTIFELTIILSVIGVAFFWALSLKSSLQNKVYDAERKGRLIALKENLQTYFLQNNTFPSEEQFNDENTRKDILDRYIASNGEDYLKDPKDNSKLILYLPEPEGCKAEEASICNKVSISLDLSNGEEFIQFVVAPGKELELLKETIEEGTAPQSEEDRYNSIISEPEPGD